MLDRRAKDPAGQYPRWGAPLFGHIRRILLERFLVSNVPVAMLLAPAARGAAGLHGLLWGVTAGGCGTPIASIANLIGAQLFLQSGAPARPFWKKFTAVSLVFLAALASFALLLLKVQRVQ